MKNGPRDARLFFGPRTFQPCYWLPYNAAFGNEGSVMRLLAWLVKLGFFLLVLWFALKNTTPVPVRFSADLTLDHVPLILVMLICVAVGALAGALALALPIYRMRREVLRLRASVPQVPAADALAERGLSAARQSGAVAEVGGDRA
jgi:lipopolysaccharide assembly protein A